VDPFERRVERALEGLPDPDTSAEEQTRRVALDALSTPTPRIGRRATLLIAAALAVGLAGGGALAAFGGALRDEPPPPKRPAEVAAPATGKIVAPPSATGVTALVDGKLWLATRNGLTMEGFPANAAALSPAARFVVLGVGASLVAMVPDGRRAWSLATPGGIVGAAWAPNPILIAYVVTTRSANELWLVEGNGDNPQRIVGDVAPVTPSWRPDSLAIAYVDHQGRAMVYDRPTGATYPAGPSRCLGRPPARATRIAFAPSGGERAQVAYITRRGEVVASGSGARAGACRQILKVSRPTSLAWISGTDFAVATRPAPKALAPNSYLLRYRAAAGLEEMGNASIGAGAVMLDIGAARGDRLLLAVAGDPRSYHDGLGPRAMPPSRLEVWWVRVPPKSGTVPAIHPRGIVLRLDGRVARRALAYSSAAVAWR
jgi:hypothetical protein